MQKQPFKFSIHIIKQWPEVFENLYMDTMPLEYLESMTLEFSNGRVWKIDVIDQIKDQNQNDIAQKILDTFEEYQNEIIKIDFRIDVDKLKKDIKKSTQKVI